MSSKSPKTTNEGLSSAIDQVKVKMDTPEQPHGASIEDLVRKIAILEEERVKEGRARNYLQLERDRILQFWDITKARLATTEAALRHKTLEIEEQQAAHSMAIKVYRDRIRSLVALYGDQEIQAKITSENAMQQHTRECAAASATLRELHQAEQRRAREDVQNTKEAHLQESMKCEQRIEQCRAEYERGVASVHDSYETRVADQVHLAEERCQAQILATAAQRDAAVAQLEARHEAFLQETREHHAATVARQLDLVAALKGAVHAARTVKHHTGKQSSATANSTTSADSTSCECVGEA